jgi:XTP/dITP diphosphohydrolase
LKKIIIASSNEGKVFEIKDIFDGLGLKIFSLKDFDDVPEIIEDGDSFEANARIKAHKVFEKYKIPAIGDDSGLAVDQLGGRPGIYSARYSGKNATYADNNIKLLKELSDFPEPYYAQFICTAVYYDGSNDICKTGKIKGQIIKTPKGTNGFGYDPVFVPEEYNRTLAELTAEEKNKISHRARAFGEMKQELGKILK